MSQRHTIHREIVELTVAHAATAERVSTAVSDVVREALTPLLERIFDELTPHAELIRIDWLELDLGRLDLDSLSRELPARIAARLPGALRSSVALSHHPQSTSPAPAGRAKPAADAAALLVINHFVTTGTLPWWCDGHDRDLLNRAADSALRQSPASLAHSLRGLVADPAAMNRLVGHLADTTLERIVAALAPEDTAILHQLAELLETSSIAGLTPRRKRLAIWRGLLQAACAAPRADPVETALTSIAIAAGMTLTALLEACAAALAMRPSPAVLVARIAELERIHSALASEPPRAPRSWPPGSMLAGLHAELAPLAARLAAREQPAWAESFARLAEAPVGPSFDTALAAVLQPLRQAGLITPADAERLQARLSRRPAPVRQDDRERRAPDDVHSVMAAGVCLLWPFLPRFFARRGLLDDKETGFVSLAAQQRAVLLLHHLATGEPDAPEFALLLPKALCGLPPFDPCEIAAPITDTEQAEAGALIDAAIAHASCLGAISRTGLRETFLMRSGLLGTRDGAWLLRLERRGADVLLERLPWTLQWLRLPWMQAAMRVEW
ncbi:MULTISPECIES: contractile injection system tape measure protein [unclassified Bradyrhizobium]|uniref:contractile injection system tape measure protein n=1 Tax=unclassified Bradyrhizobium TaxID=2631580 RepID=UPI0028E7FF82|nr:MULTISPECIES: contractile injection system tape measure protein [unclassified Bradyrhizobium]